MRVAENHSSRERENLKPSCPKVPPNALIPSIPRPCRTDRSPPRGEGGAFVADTAVFAGMSERVTCRQESPSSLAAGTFDPRGDSCAGVGSGGAACRGVSFIVFSRHPAWCARRVASNGLHVNLFACGSTWLRPGLLAFPAIVYQCFCVGVRWHVWRQFVSRFVSASSFVRRRGGEDRTCPIPNLPKPKEEQLSRSARRASKAGRASEQEAPGRCCERNVWGHCSGVRP